jgi:hypothetical protein
MFNLKNTKGYIGTVTADFYNYNGTSRLYISSASNSSIHAKTVKTADSEILNFGPLMTWPPKKDYPRWVMTFYYPWYGLQDWNEPTLKDWPLSPYSSDQIGIIAQHIQWAASNGIDVFISSWWGKNHYTDKNLLKILNTAKGSSIKITVYFETVGLSEKNQNYVVVQLKYVLNKYSGHPRFLKYKGKPVIFLYAVTEVAKNPGKTPLQSWKSIIKKVEKQTGIDAVWIGDSLNIAFLEVFDGLHSYAPQGYHEELDEIIPVKSMSVQSYHLLNDTPASKIWASPVFPGYDDRLLKKYGYRESSLYVPRKDGKTYRESLKVALDSYPDWITITSFNEWWEHTHIEPSKKYGLTYLNITKNYAVKFKQ